MEANTGFADRDRIFDYLRKQLIGPIEGDDEILDDQPQHRYLTAILYPIAADSGAPVTGRSDNDDEIIDEAPGQLSMTMTMIPSPSRARRDRVPWV